ncbi:MAG: hypothetical protein MJB57_11620, partial [Gemmatimonadetes bacterium]|nr:hypothetical protein [Gemmatimonadota bacterium]
ARPLQAWRKAQLGYYADPTAYRRWYPPRLVGPRVETTPIGESHPASTASRPESDSRPRPAVGPEAEARRP